jgi:protein-disulfide isomerase
VRTQSWTAIGAVAAAVCLMAAAPPVAGGNGTGGVAIVAGQAVTEQELSAAVGNKLLRVKTEEFNIRRASLDEIIANRVLRAEAARRNIPVDELLRIEVESKVTIPSPADLESFYEGTKERFAGVGKDEAIKQIGDGMRRQQAAKKRNAFVQSLRAAAGVSVFLEPPRVDVKPEGPVRGNPAAPVTIVEFSDFECTFCSRAVETLHKVRGAYGDKVRIVYRDFPLPGHRGAAKAAEAAHCAEEQGKFWEMHDRLFAKSGAQQTETELRKAGADVGLDDAALSRCLASGKYAPAWKSSQEEGTRVGVSFTPTFFINGRMIAGAAPYEIFAAVVDEEIDRAGARGVAAGTAAAAAHR